MYFKVFRALVPCMLLCFLSACDRGESRQRSLSAVRVVEMQVTPGGQGQVFSVSIVPYTQVNLSFKVSGYVESILQLTGADGRSRDVQQNDPVKKGQVLARIRQSEYVDQLNEAKANLSKARAGMAKARDDYQRARNLYSSQSITQREFDQARKEYQSYQADISGAQAQVAEAGTNLGYTSLQVPWDGILLQRDVEVGALVNPGATGFVLADTTSVKALLGVPEAALGRVKTGDRLRVHTRESGNPGYVGVVTAISPQADSQTRLFEVEITVPNSDGRLRSGMIGSVALAGAYKSADGLYVPLDAVVRSKNDASQFAVFVVEPVDRVATALLRDIRISGDIRGNRVGVVEGLKAGDRVVVNGAQMLTDREPVNVIP